MRASTRALAVLAFLVVASSRVGAADAPPAIGRTGGTAVAPGNLLDDPSFEQPKERDRFGLVFAKWGGWKYEGDCEFAVGQLGRTGKHSCLLLGRSSPKIRVAQQKDLPAGRYRVTAYLRGLDIATGIWNQTTEFMFDGKYIQLKKNGTFGWTKLTYVADIDKPRKVGPSFGLMAAGCLWIDDVCLEKVGPEVALTPAPVLDKEEAPLAPPGPLPASPVRCVECGYRNDPAWKRCYACGTELEARQAAPAGPPVRPIASFEARSEFSGGVVVAEHATDGRRALRIDRSYATMDRPQDWTGYDYLEADLFVEGDQPLSLYVEVRDAQTRDYWTRVNYNTVVPPGASTLTLPVRQLYVGEKSRPGRPLQVNAVTRLVLSVGDKPPAPLFVDHIRLRRDDSAPRARFEGLHAFDLGVGTSPVLEGFTPVTSATLYSAGRGYGLKNARIWRSYDALQPEPLFQDFICIESGGLAIDVPKGKYRVWVNIDSPSGYWGEYQTYTRRAVLAEGKPAVSETMDFDSARRKYYRFWDVEDTPADDTFDKYQQAYFQPKTFDVEVSDGQLNIDFQGENWACCVSAVVVFPLDKAADGERFLQFVQERRRFHFNNYFKRVLHQPARNKLSPTPADERRGYLLFVRDWMRDVYYNDLPDKAERDQPLRADAFAGEMEPITLSVLPLRDLGRSVLTVSDLSGPGGTIPASAVQIGYVSYRLSRVTMEGSVYTIAPRLVMPRAEVDLPKDVVRRFWLTLRVPPTAAAGVYKGTVTLRPSQGATAAIGLEVRVRKGTLDEVDVPAGPWGSHIRVPWRGDDPQAAQVNRQMFLASLRRMREYGFTSCSGMPQIPCRGFKDGKCVLDFDRADEEMRAVKDLGFRAVVAYGAGVTGFNAYYQDLAAAQKAGFKDYPQFIRAIYSEVQKHAEQAGWIPVYYNLADEPIGNDLVRSAENAEAYRAAFPKGPPFFAAASSFTGSKADDPHFRLARAAHVANWNLHDEASVNLLRQAGGAWAFYNGGNRWTFGDYMYKAARQFGMVFRLSWHWNCAAGDPYYALDCREDDYAWCNSAPDGRLVPAIHFEQLREGLDDYRRLITLERLAKAKADTPAGKIGLAIIRDRMAAFKLAQRNHDALLGGDDWTRFRRKVDEAIEGLRD